MTVLLLIVKLLLVSGLLYGYYYLALRNKRFHRYNRFYLLVTAIVSVVLPFVEIPLDIFGLAPQNSGLIKSIKVISINEWKEPVNNYASLHQGSEWWTLQNGLLAIYIVGAVYCLFLLLQSIRYLLGLKRKYPKLHFHKLEFFNTSEKGTPFSFFSNIFWNQEIPIETKAGQQIFQHELFHVREKHSADLLLIEILTAICWFNPFFHLIKREIKALHEFLADAYAASANNRYEYAELLVLQAIRQKTGQGLSHPFFHNHIKRRITMITQSNLVSRSGYFSRLMALPLLFLLVSAFAVKIGSSGRQPASMHSYAPITLVIDAGHGGPFVGGIGTNGIKEKDLNLLIARKIKELSSQYPIHVVLTRTEDKPVGNSVDLGDDLDNRVKLTNEAKPDLFISIHVNASETGSTDKSGFEAYISGRKSSPKSKELAGILLSGLKDIYPVSETIQESLRGVRVLDKNDFPSVLLECGYITNQKDLDFISKPENQEKIAKSILEGVQKFAQQKVTIAFQEKISVAAFIKLNPSDIKDIDVDLKKTDGIIHFKNGNTQYFNVKDVNQYYASHPAKEPIKGYTTHINMVDSSVNIAFVKEEAPKVNHNSRHLLP